jgi:hypothetical protein
MHSSLISDIKISIDDARNDGKTSKISGWCFSFSKDVIQEIRLKQNDKIFVGEHGFVREDVKKHYGAIMASDKESLDAADKLKKGILHSGFSININDKLNRSGEVIIETLKLGSNEWQKVQTLKKAKQALLFEDLEIENTLKLSKNLNTDVVVIDNIYEDPDSVREFALSCEFQENSSYHKGQRSKEKFLTNELKALFERSLNKKITSWENQPHNGVFQFCIAEDSLVYHVDAQTYAAIIYLHPSAPPSCGTTLYRSKSTGLRRSPTEDDAKRLGMSTGELHYKIFKNNFYDKSDFETVDVVGNVYNRCSIFNAKTIHSASEYFGNSKENSRLFHIFFFNAK